MEMQQQMRLAHPAMLPFAPAVTQAITSTTKLALQTHAVAAMEMQQQMRLAHPTMLKFAPAVTQAIASTTKLALWEKSSAAALLRMSAARYMSWQRCMTRSGSSMSTVKKRMMQSLC